MKKISICDMNTRHVQPYFYLYFQMFVGQFHDDVATSMQTSISYVCKTNSMTINHL